MTPTGKEKFECEGGKCYHNLDERTILRDVERGTVPDAALVKSCCWSKICKVRDKYKYRVGIHSEAWNKLCTRMGTVRDRTGWFRPGVHREPLLEALRAAREKAASKD